MAARIYWHVKCEELGINKTCMSILEVEMLLDNWTEDWQEKFIVVETRRREFSVAMFKELNGL